MLITLMLIISLHFVTNNKLHCLSEGNRYKSDKISFRFFLLTFLKRFFTRMNGSPLVPKQDIYYNG